MSARGLFALSLLALLLAPLAIGWLPHAADAASASVPPIAGTPLAASGIVAAVAAALATMLGSAFAAALVLTRVPGRALWATLLLVPFVSPPTVWTLSQVACYGRGGLLEQLLSDDWRPALAWLNQDQYLATTLVLAQVHAPLAMLVLMRGLSRLRFAGWEAARLFVNHRGRLPWMLQALRQELLAAYLLIFALALSNFAVPHALQCRLHIVEVYLRSANYLDQPAALLAALPLAVMALVAAVGFAWLDRGASYAATTGDAPTTGRTHWSVMTAVASYVALIVVAPIIALLRDCRSISRFTAAVQAAAPETINTLVIATGAALVACLVAGVIAPWYARRRTFLAELLAIVPLGFPALVIGLAYARTYHRPLPMLGLITDTALLVVLGLAVRGLPFAVRLFTASARGQARCWEEAGQLAGLGAWHRLRWITFPLWLNTAVTAAIVVFVLAAGDVELSHLLTPPGSGTLAMRLFTFLHFGPAHVTASLALWQLLVTLLPVLIYFLLTDRWVRFI